MTASRHLIAVLAAAATSCAEPDIIHCADGRVCALGTVCVPTGCAQPGCGDNDLDSFFGEECDDGNLTAGDGCSPACLVERCSNGILETMSGEQCDDGNLLSHDGCSSQCLRETATWRALVDIGAPPSITGAAAAWDPDRGRAIIHGGSLSGVRTADVWTFDGTWHREPAGPPALSSHRMAWDGAGSIVLFGGDPARSDCWIWNGTWTPCSGPLPPGRAEQGMATAPGGGILMFGGLGTAMDTSTWRWKAGAWTDAGVAGPRPLFFASMVLDPVRAAAVLVGIDPMTGSAPTWFLGTTGWTVIGAELPRYQPSMTYDPDRQRVVAFGGTDTGITLFDDGRELDLDRWSVIPASPRPPGRTSAVMFHDAIRRGVVLFGGNSIAPDNTTWIMRWESATPDELCTDATVDADGDALAGCADPDCWGRCDPRCPPAHPDCAPSRPRCGDTVCNPWLETHALCPEDCP